MKKKRLQYLRQLVGVRYCGIFYQEITSDLRVKEIVIIILIIMIMMIIIIMIIIIATTTIILMIIITIKSTFPLYGKAA